jgi:multidrug efflux pump subunit AcrA (membrane-fusion protein)
MNNKSRITNYGSSLLDEQRRSIKMNRMIKWTAGVLLLIGLGVGGTVVLGPQLGLNGSTPVQAQAATNDGEANAQQTVKIQPAANVIGQVSASGKLALAQTHYVVLDVNGEVQTVNVQVGDTVAAGDLLLKLDTTELERAVKRAEINVSTAKNTLAQLQKPADALEIAAAEAELASAQEKLIDAQKPATAAELAAAKASVSAAWAKYNELTSAKSSAEITKLEANLRKAEIAMKEAQRAYDAVKWRNDVGMTPEAAKLQQATIDYEAAKADYEVTTKPANQSDLQNAVSSAKNAEKQLTDLQNKPNAADIAAAQAQVANAQQKLDNLKEGKDSLEIEAAQLKLESALVDWQEAIENANRASVTAPVNGTVLSVNAELGQKLSNGATVVTLADLNALELAVNVAEVDIDQIQVGQAAEITIDALQGEQFTGEVVRYNPISNGGTGVVNYKVTLRLDGAAIQGVLPDMTAVAKLVNTQAASGWLVPTTALTTDGAATTVNVLRNGEAQRVVITPGVQQGEWTVVQSAELQAGDEVVGAVASYEGNGEDLADFGGPPGNGG